MAQLPFRSATETGRPRSRAKEISQYRNCSTAIWAGSREVSTRGLGRGGWTLRCGTGRAGKAAESRPPPRATVAEAGAAAWPAGWTVKGLSGKNRRPLRYHLRGRPETRWLRGLKRDAEGGWGRLRSAGAIVMGQDQTCRRGAFGLPVPTTSCFGNHEQNPWDGPHGTPGGSSGGAAAAVAAGFVCPGAWAVGSWAGPLRIPAAWCGGVTRSKPSSGHRPR